MKRTFRHSVKNFFKKWAVPLEAVGVTIFSYIVPSVLFVIFMRVIYRLDTKEKFTEFFSRPVVNFSLYLFVAALSFRVIQVVLNRRKRTLQEIGFKKPVPFDLVNILAAYGVYAIVLRIAFAFVVSVFPSLNTNIEQQTGYNSAAGRDVVFAFFGLVVLAPIFEELLFRGMLYKGLRTKLSALPAAIVTSIVFAALHSPWTAQLDVFILSFALIWLVEVTGSLWTAIGLHMFKNFLAFYLLFILHR